MLNHKLYHSFAHTYETPLYVYSEEYLRRQFQRLDRALDPLPHRICYAVKANSNLALLQVIAELGGGFDIVSEGELARVDRAIGDTSRVVFSGVGKTREEIRSALLGGVFSLNVESASELDLITTVAQETGKVASIALRINPNISADTHRYLATGLHSTKFGIDMGEARALTEKISRSPSHLALIGITCHIGSQIADVNALKDAYCIVVEFASLLASQRFPIQFVDFGGGLAVSYSGHYEPLNVEEMAMMVKEVMKGTSFQVLFEPGKYLIAEAGVLLTQVVHTKETPEKKFVVVDAGMNDLIRPSLYGAHHHMDVIPLDGAAEERPIEKVDIVGPVCETGCYLALDRELPQIVSGDLIAIADAGAYGFSMASSYNSRRRPAEVLVRVDGTVQLIRERESYTDLYSHERLLSGEPA